ncbi:MAG: T9SS type A sorting domain-containing protein [Bacteroidales bacterium]|jgi:hypothetical protein|nr:T9SS type A sorting domain-containing protein [Bacteroidales bacterium]
MKQILFLLAFLLSSAITYSQSIAILGVNENDISGTTISIPIMTGMYEAAYSIKIKNLTSNPIDLKITKIYEEGPVDGSDNTMCSPNTATGTGTCFQSSTMITTPFTLAGNEISGNAEMHYEPGVNSGTTTIRYKVQNTTNATDFAFVTLSFSTTSATLPKETEAFSIFPNPANDYIVISCNKGGMGNNSDMRDKFLVEIYDVTGKLHISLISQISQKINVADLPSGIYFCRFSGNNNIEKIVKLFIK